MKRNLLFIGFLCFSLIVMAQENRFSLSGGYVFANLEDVDTDATGWRINARYEFNPGNSFFSHGISFGYMNTSTDFTSQTQNSNYKINSWPVYYEPKVTIGSGKFKGFLKGALGMHFSGYKRTGTVTEITSADMGFYGGASAGSELMITDKLFINAEYDWAFMSNSYYREGFINSAMVGIGFKF